MSESFNSDGIKLSRKDDCEEDVNITIILFELE